jgi:Na+-transporting NADH:ubiquinone oxidoreductase subunit NqrE
MCIVPRFTGSGQFLIFNITKSFNNFYHPITNLTIYQRGVHHIFNNFPTYIKVISNNVKKFEIGLKRFLHIHSFYSIEKYFQHKSITS